MRVTAARCLEGGAAGLLATLPMTAVMEIGRLLPPSQQYPLPPRLVVERVAEETETPLPQDEERRVSLTVAAHFAYGAGMGALYGPAFPPSIRVAALRGWCLASASGPGATRGCCRRCMSCARRPSIRAHARC